VYVINLLEINFVPLTYAQYEFIGSGGYMLEDVMAIMVNGECDIDSLITPELELDD